MSQKSQTDLPEYENYLSQSEINTTTGVLVLDGSNTLSCAAAVDPLRAANRQAGAPLYNWTFLTPEDHDVRLTSGLTIKAAPIVRAEPVDLLLVVAGFELEKQATPALCAGIRRLSASAAIVAGIDGGPWIMARAGILTGHRATTHWEDLQGFERMFPAVQTENARFVDSENRLTSGGAGPAIDMMLHLIARQHGDDLAARIAGSFIYNADVLPTRPQHRQAPHGSLSGIPARAHAIMEMHLENPVPLHRIARMLGISQRSLQMHFKDGPGFSPQTHYLRLRMAEAGRLVRESDLPLHEISLASGFGSQSSFARAFRVHFGQSARRYRIAVRPG